MFVPKIIKEYYKWLYLFENANISRTRYFFSMISYFLSQFIRVFIVLLIWYSIFRNEGVDFKFIFTYYIIGEFYTYLIFLLL